MSRIGKNPISIKDVTVTKKDQNIKIKGKLGELEMTIHPDMIVEVEGDQLLVKRPNDIKQNKSITWFNKSFNTKYGYWCY